MTIFSTFGLNLKIFFAQLLSFAIFFWILYRFAIKPIWAILEERRRKVNESLAKIDLSKQSVVKAEEEARRILSNAQKEAEKIRVVAEEQGRQLKGMLKKEAKEETELIIGRGRKALQREKNKMVNELQQEFGNLVVSAIKRVLKKDFLKEEETDFVLETLKEVKITNDEKR